MAGLAVAELVEQDVEAVVHHDTIAPDEIIRALADVVGTEPGPLDVRALYRTPLPGLGPLDRLEHALRRYVGRLRAHGVPPEAVVVHVKRTVRDVLPSRTPEWSAYLLTEAVVQWSIDAYDSGR
jgi:hypothetical protein